jgi:hypothetical protein
MIIFFDEVIDNFVESLFDTFDDIFDEVIFDEVVFDEVIFDEVIFDEVLDPLPYLNL